MRCKKIARYNEEKMKIEILGTGCPKCRSTEKMVRQVVDELEMDVDIQKVESIEQIMERGVMMTPAVAIDDDIKIVGHVPGKEELTRLLEEAG
ncbi:MAG: thioredoxin family protein [Thermoplasmatota archaeon]